MPTTPRGVGRKRQLPPSRTADPADEPSAEWGWHGTFPVGIQVGGWISAAICFAMLNTTHTSKTEWVWLIGIGTAIVLFLLWDLRRRRNTLRR